MIKINVFVSNKSWRKHIKSPDIYLKKKSHYLIEKTIFLKIEMLVFLCFLAAIKKSK